MCGIIGLIAKTSGGFFQTDVNLFSQMLVTNAVRGIDGTGVFGVYNTGSIGWLKVGSHPYALLNNKKFDSFSTAMTRKMNMVVGHNRKATGTAINNDNAHPFFHDHIILVHNGMIHNHKAIADTEVDSNAIAHSIVSKGYEEALATLKGAFALVWFDMNDRTLRFVRNPERPLYLLETDTQIVFASEGPMLEWLGERNNKMWKKPALIPPSELFSISQETKTIASKKIQLHSYQTAIYQQPSWPKMGLDPEFDSALSDNALDDAARLDAAKEMLMDGIPFDDSDPIAVAIREQAPELEDDDDVNIEADIAAFLNVYKDGVTVTFEPKSMTPWNNNGTIRGYNLDGVLRADKNIAVRACFEGVNVYATVVDFMNHKVLKGVISGAMVNPTTSQKTLQVKYVTPLNVYRSFNGTSVTADEWVALCDKYHCMHCGKKVKIADIKGSSVNLTNPENPRLFCPACVTKHLEKMPPEQQEVIRRLNGNVELLISDTEKDWNLKGATHGS